MATPVVRNTTVKSHYESVERVISAMRQRIDEPLSLGSMAKIAFTSRYHFNRTFREVTGVPPSQFLYALRLERAKRLLMETQQKVIDICYAVGYNSVGTFTRRFTDMLGISPRAFREMVQSPQGPMGGYSSGGADLSDTSSHGSTVSGYVSAPSRFQGLIFIGLFETAIPQGKPVACAITTKAGPYQFGGAPQGEFYLFALGLEYPIQSPDCFHYELALRGGGHRLRIYRDSVKGLTYLRLRPPSPLDPPILLALPLLMEQPAATQNGNGERPGTFQTAHASSRN